jgi:U4/U6.U5 tri-snRNP component SNU23
VVGDIPASKKKEKEQEDLEAVVLPNERTDFLKARRNDLALEAKVGKTMTIAKDTSGAVSGKKKTPFFCTVCDVDFNDSHSYVDHLNGKRHNRILGMNMKVEAVTADRIKDKLEWLAKKGPIKVAPAEDQGSAELGKREPLDEESDSEGKEEGVEEEEPDETDLAMAAMGLPTKLK